MHVLAVKYSNSDQAICYKYVFSVLKCSLGFLCAIMAPNGKGTYVIFGHVDKWEEFYKF